MNGYFPQGENINHETKFPKKIKYYDDLKNHIKDLQKTKENLIVMGDFNVAPQDTDIGIGADNVKRWPSFHIVSTNSNISILGCDIKITHNNEIFFSFLQVFDVIF